MSNVRVCVDVVGGDEKPQVVLDGRLRLPPIPISRSWQLAPPKSSIPLQLPMHVLRPLRHLTLSPWMTIPFAP